MAKNKNSKLSGPQGFEEYYSNIYGARWAELKSSFSTDSRYFELKIQDSKPYFLDCASVLAASCLPLENASKILDLCAAPGGKSLVLASRMAQDCLLISNERSAERRNRLISVLQESLPGQISSRVSVMPFDGSLICKKYSQEFDSILLDAPCSSERHVFSSPKYLEMWSSARIRNLSFTQWSLLSSSFRVLKENGYLLYSTCAIATDENDGVIEKLVNKFKDANVCPIDFEKVYSSMPSFLKVPTLVCEKTKFGYQILPDKNDGAGPLFFALIKKKNQSKS